jgi:hypothetical protein
MTDQNKEKKAAPKKPEKFDTSVIEPDEYFSYLGKKYMKTFKYHNKYDEEGRPVVRYVWHMDGSKQAVGVEKAEPVEEFYGITEIKTDTPKTLAKWGKPLTTNIVPYGPINPIELFKYEDEPITYDNRDLSDTVLVRKGNKIVKQGE